MRLGRSLPTMTVQNFRVDLAPVPWYIGGMLARVTCPVCQTNFIPNYSGRVCCSAMCAAKRQGTPSERFFSFVEKTAKCWRWSGRLEDNGYGRFKVHGERISAHRFSYELVNGPITNSLFVLHRCDNRWCVNPAHLFLGTQKDNLDDMRKKGRAVQVRGAAHGRAKLTEEQARDILRRARAGTSTQKELAQEYGLHFVYVNRLVNGKRWAHLQG